MEVGVRELRDGLSRHLAMVRQGHSITVTDHGRPVARIVPVAELTTLERLIAEGRVTPGRRSRKSRKPPLKASGTVSDLVELRSPLLDAWHDEAIATVNTHGESAAVEHESLDG